MTTTYEQDTGKITLASHSVIWGYSGHGDGLNNPAMETVHGVGCIPKGRWEIIEWYDNYGPKGPVVARLKPIGHDAHGRDGFLIHGDNPLLNHTASDGCIVSGYSDRVLWRTSGDIDIEVI